MRVFRILVWPAAGALAIAAEWSAYDWGDVRHWLPDLFAGTALLVCGLNARRRRPESLSGALMVVAGATWFLPNFATTGASPIDWLLARLVFAHRGALIALVVTYPVGRLRGRLDTGTVLAAAVASMFVSVWDSPAATVAVAAALVAVAARRHAVAVGGERRRRAASLWATIALAGIFAGVGLAHLSGAANAQVLLAYQLALAALAAGLLAALVRSPWEPRRIGDLVIELGETRTGTLRDALARALGDPTLQVGFWSPRDGAYLDSSGAVVEAGQAPIRSATRIDLDGEAVAVLIHDRAVLDDQGLREAVGTASALAAANVRLRAEVGEQVSELESSRRRLLEAADLERRRLERRLHGGAEQRLAALRTVLASAAATVSSGSEAGERVERAAAQLERTLGELGELARGLHPQALVDAGLAEALRGLAADSAVQVDLSVTEERLPQEIESAVYFLCAEGIANAVKYAGASHVDMRVSVDGASVLAEITDDGVGGADPARGTGLTGLGDRVEALGGRLQVVSPRGAGTRVSAEVPLRA